MGNVPCDEEQRDELPAPVVPRQLAHKCILGRREGKVLGRGHELEGCRREKGGHLAHGTIGSIYGLFGGEKHRPDCIECKGIEEFKNNIHGEG